MKKFFFDEKEKIPYSVLNSIKKKLNDNAVDFQKAYEQEVHNRKHLKDKRRGIALGRNK